MDYVPTTHTMTVGHAQHGKSTLAGILYLESLKRFLPEKNAQNIINKINANLIACNERYNYPTKLKYAMIFDGPRRDLYDYTGHKKTTTTKPYTLHIHTNEIRLAVTDLPGHQTWLRRVSGALEVCDVAIFVIEAKAIHDDMKKNDVYFTDRVKLRTPKNVETYDHNYAPKSYIDMLKKARDDARKRKLSVSSSLKVDTKEKPLIPPGGSMMKPDTISGIFNYLCLCWYMGIKRFLFAIHKMDLVDINLTEEYYTDVVELIEIMKTTLIPENSDTEYNFEYVPTAYICDAVNNHENLYNITRESKKFDWYKKECLFDVYEKMINACLKEKKKTNQNEPLRFQVDGYNLEPGLIKNYFKPCVHGYLHSGILKQDDELFFPTKTKVNSWFGPVRVESYKPADSIDSKTGSADSGDFWLLYLNRKDVDNIVRSKDRKLFIYEGNFATSKKDKDLEPIIVTNNVIVEFVFIGGWLFRSDFHARLIYGFNRIDAKFINIEYDETTKKCKCKAELTEPIPFCHMGNLIVTGKAVIERDTFIIGIGSVISVEPFTERKKRKKP